MTRRRGALLAAVGVLALGALLAGLFLQDADAYREDLGALLGETLGHPVTISGPLTLTWRPSPALTAREVSMTAPEAAVRIETVRVAVDSGALLARRLQATEVVADDVEVTLSSAPGAVLTVLPDPAALPVQRLVLRDLRLVVGGAQRAHLRRLSMGEARHPEGARLEVEAAAPRVQGRARMSVSDGVLALTQIEVDTALGAVRGALTLDAGGERPRLTGQLRANALSMPATSIVEPGRVVPRPELDVSALALFDARVTLRVGRLSVGDWQLNEVELPLRVSGGALHLPAAGVLAGGPLSVDLALRPGAGGAPPGVRLALELRQANAGDTLVMAGLHGAERGGRLDARVRLDAAGATGDALLASLAGEIVLDARKVTLRASAAELAASDVFAGLMRMLRGERSNRISLECATAGLVVRAGVLRSAATLGVQSRDANALGGGTLSLPDETVDLLLRPWPRAGLGPSARAVADEVAISGALAGPTMEFRDEASGAGAPDAGDTAAERAALGARLRERARGDAPCARPGSTVPVDVWS